MTTHTTKKMTLLAGLLGLGLGLSGSAMAANTTVGITPFFFMGPSNNVINDTFTVSIHVSSTAGSSTHVGTITNPPTTLSYLTWNDRPEGAAGSDYFPNGFLKAIGGTSDTIAWTVAVTSKKVGALSCPTPASVSPTDLTGMVITIGLTPIVTPTATNYTCLAKVYTKTGFMQGLQGW